MIIRTNPPTSKTLTLSLLTFLLGAGLWFSMPEYAVYAVGSMILAYIILLSGTLFNGI